MRTIGFHIEDVVPVIGSAGGHAQSDEGHQGGPQSGPLVQHTGGAGSREDENVLDPLFGTSLPQVCACAHAATGSVVIGSRPTRTGTLAIASI